MTGPMASAKSSYRAEPLFGRPPIPEDHAKTKVASGAPKFAAILALVVFLGGGAQLAAVYSASSQLPDVRRDDGAFDGLDPQFLRSIEEQMETEGSGKQNDKPLPVGVRAVPETDTPQYVRTPGTGMPRKARHFIDLVAIEIAPGRFKFAPRETAQEKEKASIAAEGVVLKEMTEELEKIKDDIMESAETALREVQQPAGEQQLMGKQPQVEPAASLPGEEEGHVPQHVVFLQQARKLSDEEDRALRDLIQREINTYRSRVSSNPEEFEAARKELFKALMSSDDVVGAFLWVLAHFDMNRMREDWKQWTKENINGSPSLASILQVYHDQVDQTVVQGMIETYEEFMQNNWRLEVGRRPQ